MFRFVRRLIVVLIIIFLIYLMFRAVAPNTTRKLSDKIGSFYITSECEGTECPAVISTGEVFQDEAIIDSNTEKQKEKIGFRDRIRNFFSPDDGDDIDDEDKIETESGDKENIDEVEVFTGETQTEQVVSTGEIIIQSKGESTTGEQEIVLPVVSDEQSEAQKVIDSLF